MKYYIYRPFAFSCLMAFLILSACDDTNPVCGNGTLDEGEPCEPGVAASGCIKAGYWGGEPGCTADCHRDYSLCERIENIQLSNANSCVLSSYGKVYCWGDGRQGLNGDGTWEMRTSPVEVNFGSLDNVQLSQSGGHACAIDGDGWISCWGDNSFGQLGDGTEIVSASPRGVYQSTDRKFVQVATTGWGTSAIDETGQLWQWGFMGETEAGASIESTVPVLVDAVAHLRFKQVYGHWDAHCATDVDDQLWCWGSNSENRLCQFDSTENFEPFILYPQSGTRFIDVAMNRIASCFLDDMDNMQCCGLVDLFGDVPMPIDFPSNDTLVSISLGTQNIGIVLDESGDTATWEAKDEGQIKYDDVVPSNIHVSAISWRMNSGCILDEKGYPWCYGSNLFGEVGVGTTVPVEQLVRIKTPNAK